MNLARIRSEFGVAQQQFAQIELYPTSDGKVYVRAALQPSAQQFYIVSMYFPDTYPNEMPSVYVDKPVIDSSVPHRYTRGNICYLHPKMWNPGRHDISFVLGRTAKWLSKYEIWKLRRRWPGASLNH